jgi:hypothetical protein
VAPTLCLIFPAPTLCLIFLPPPCALSSCPQENGAFERGHDGMWLEDFHSKIRARWDKEQKAGAALPDFNVTLCEVGVRFLWREELTSGRKFATLTSPPAPTAGPPNVLVELLQAMEQRAARTRRVQPARWRSGAAMPVPMSRPDGCTDRRRNCRVWRTGQPASPHCSQLW